MFLTPCTTANIARYCKKTKNKKQATQNRKWRVHGTAPTSEKESMVNAAPDFHRVPVENCKSCSLQV